VDTSRRLLVVFYSRSETTAAIARRLATELDADCERLQEADDRRRTGAVGFLRSLADVIRDRAADLRPTACSPSAYDVVVIGTPVWAGRASTPVSTWLARHGSKLRATAFFCTMGLRGDLTAFGQLQALARGKGRSRRARFPGAILVAAWPLGSSPVLRVRSPAGLPPANGT